MKNTTDWYRKNSVLRYPNVPILYVLEQIYVNIR